jgi:hypothetical protein
MFERTQLDHVHVLLSLKITHDPAQTQGTLVKDYRRFFDQIEYIQNENLQPLNEEQAEVARTILNGEVIAAPVLPQEWKSAKFRTLIEQAASRRRSEADSIQPTYLCLLIDANPAALPIEDDEEPEMIF